MNGHNNFFSNPSSPCYGTYMNDGDRQIDYILVYKEEEHEHEHEEVEAKERREFYEQNCEKEGIELEKDKVNIGGESLVFTKVHIPWKVLFKNAELLEMKSPLWIHDKPPIRKQMLMEPNKKVRMYGKSTVINWPFKRKHIERYAVRDERTFFTPKQRIEVAHELLQTIGNSPHDPLKRGLEVLVEEKIYESAYPIHDCDIDIPVPDTHNDHTPSRHGLSENWARWKMIIHRQPLTDIRDYFGEKIGFYYAFMDTYTRMLIYPTIVGLAIFLTGIIFAAHSQDIHHICHFTPHEHEASGEHEGNLSHHGSSFEGEHGSNTESVKLEPMGQNTSGASAILEETTWRTSANSYETTTSVGENKAESEGQIFMCPICTPPHCEYWELYGPEACFYYGWAFRFDNPFSFVLSGFTTLWAIIFIKMWKRHESGLAAEWNVHDMEEKELVIRPEYEERAPTKRKNPVTHELEPYIPLSKRCLWMSGSVSATILFLVFACACSVAMVVGRIQLYALLKKMPDPISSKNVDCARWLVHGMLFIVVTILENVYNKVAYKLTAYECPKTDKKFMDSLLWKIFVFAILNDIIPLAYSAWIKGRTVSTPLDLGPLDELCDAGCMGEVTELVAVLLVVRLIVGNISEIGIPLFKKFWNKKKKQAESAKSEALPQYVKDFHLNEVEFDGVFEDYMEMMIQFAFIVLFIPALPIAPFLCFLNNIAEIRVDGIKMIRTNRRPLPIRVSGIGIWNRFLDILSRLGIICNAALLAFTSDNVLYLYYYLIHNPKHNMDGFVEFTLSKVPVKEFGTKGEEMLKENILECFYPAHRHSYKPYYNEDYFWQIMTLRLVVFAAYCVIFLIITWAVNTFVSDVPESVKIKIHRQHHIVVKSIEAESTGKAANMVNGAFNRKVKS